MLLVILSIVSIYSNANNRWYKGYVISHNNVLIEGLVYVPIHSQTTGAYNIESVDLEGFYSMVLFKCKDGKFDYTPDKIKEFGFYYLGVDYKFESNLLNYKSVIRSERRKGRFLNVVYRGSISMFRDSRMLSHETVGVGGGRNVEYLYYYDYYLSSNDKGMMRLFSSKETKDIKQVLKLLGMDQQFLSEIGSVKVRDLKDILIQYDIWLEQHKNRNELSV
jgi:hypothetical protein